MTPIAFNNDLNTMCGVMYVRSYVCLELCMCGVMHMWMLHFHIKNENKHHGEHLNVIFFLYKIPLQKVVDRGLEHVI